MKYSKQFLYFTSILFLFSIFDVSFCLESFNTEMSRCPHCPTNGALYTEARIQDWITAHEHLKYDEICSHCGYPYSKEYLDNLSFIERNSYWFLTIGNILTIQFLITHWGNYFFGWFPWYY